MGIGSNKGYLRIRFSHQGKRYCFYLNLQDTKSNRRQAERVYFEIQADIEEGTFDPTLDKYKPHPTLNKPLGALTCPELFAEWLNWKSAFCDPRSIKADKSLANVLSYFGKLPASSIDKKQVVTFAAWLAPKASSTTQRRRLRLFRACWEWAIANNYLTQNPWIDAVKLIKTSPKKMPKPFTKEEVSSILAGGVVKTRC